MTFDERVAAWRLAFWRVLRPIRGGALPVTVDPTSPAPTDSPGQGDDQIRAIKQALVDIFGIPSGSSITTQATTLSTDGNVAVGAGATFGTNAVNVFGLKNGTSPTTSPADVVQLWALDRNGAGTASLRLRDEEGNTEGLGVYLHAVSRTEATCTNVATDLHTLTVNIPAGDGFGVSGLVRKTAGAVATASIGLKVNGTQIFNNFAVTTSTSQAEFGAFSYPSYPTAGLAGCRATNYTMAGGMAAGTALSGGPILGYSTTTHANQLPTGAITSITITGVTGSASVTLGVDDVCVYRLARMI